MLASRGLVQGGQGEEEAAMRVYGQNLDPSRPRQPSELRGRLAAARTGMPAAELRPVPEQAEAVYNLPEAIVEQAWMEFLRVCESFKRIELAFDEQDKILWVYLTPPGRPTVT